MPDRIPKSLLNRSILTDTLPYEVPVIFSNDRLHAALSAEMPDAIAKLWRRLTEGGGYGVPYCFEIAKDDARSTTLSIVHPRLQMKMAEFYELHHTSLLSYCANDRISLRRPIALASPYVASETIDEEGRLKLGVTQLLVDEGQPDVSHLPSYFAYGKYNLLGKFIGSREFIRLEGRYLRVRTLDISKCFYNIYTHTISWAVKEKKLAKEYINAYAFEAEFDKLMQMCNYNETNGIVVGPEFSRIFAEIVLQSVDDNVEKFLRGEGLELNKHYDIRRYVDDYFVFSNAEETLDVVEGAIRRQLEQYKLYVNESKVKTDTRPFVSPLSLARQEVGALLREVRVTLLDLIAATDPQSGSRSHRRLKALLAELRLVVSKYGIAYANISGWVMSRLKRLSRRAVLALKDGVADDLRPLVGDVVVTILEQAFYVCAIDFRVRTTYSIAQFCLFIHDNLTLLGEEQQDLVLHVIMDQCSSIIRAYKARSGDKFGRKDSVEVFNLLICGSLFVGKEFLRSSDVKAALFGFMGHGTVSYFAYITLKFCFLKDQLAFQSQLNALNGLALARISADGVDISRDTEEYLLLQDWLSSPDVTAKEKRDFLNAMFDTDAFGLAGIEALSRWVGFVDWPGLSVHHLLAKKGVAAGLCLGLAADVGVPACISGS